MTGNVPHPRHIIPLDLFSGNEKMFRRITQLLLLYNETEELQQRTRKHHKSYPYHLCIISRCHMIVLCE